MLTPLARSSTRTPCTCLAAGECDVTPCRALTATHSHVCTSRSAELKRLAEESSRLRSEHERERMVAEHRNKVRMRPPPPRGVVQQSLLLLSLRNDCALPKKHVWSSWMAWWWSPPRPQKKAEKHRRDGVPPVAKIFPRRRSPLPPQEPASPQEPRRSPQQKDLLLPSFPRRSQAEQSLDSAIDVHTPSADRLRRLQSHTGSPAVFLLRPVVPASR